MKVAIAGCDGNMATRYRAILDFLGHEVKGWDRDAEPGDIDYMIKWADAIIVCTPSAHHMGSLMEIFRRTTEKPILCEKPVVKDPDQFRLLTKMVWEIKPELYCVNQYAYLPELVDGTPEGITSYDYFRHGPDGLHWDCFQLHALAKGRVELKERSPIWNCVINGARINIAHMDMAYADMLMDFLGHRRKVWGWPVIDKTTRKILSLI